MLRLEGVEREIVELRSGENSSMPSSGSGAMLGREEVDGLVDDFKRRMGVLKKVVEEGERRRHVLAAERDITEDDRGPSGEEGHDEDDKGEEQET